MSGLAEMLSSPCKTCLLWRPDWQGVTHEHGVCVWFLKKLTVPKPIPAKTAETGCIKWVDPKKKEA